MLMFFDVFVYVYQRVNPINIELNIPTKSVDKSAKRLLVNVV